MKAEFKNFILMRLYLFGEYNGPRHRGDDCGGNSQFSKKKNLESAINLIPDYFKSIYSSDEKEQEEMEFLFANEMIGKGYHLECYLPDIELKELIAEMRCTGYTEEEISRFATSFIEWLLAFERIFYSSMYLCLFGKHSSGVEVNISHIKNLEEAILLIPEYINFLTTVYERDYIMGTADLDEALYEFIQIMCREGFSEEEQLRFATAWLNAIESHDKMSLNVMEVYLSGHFKYGGGRYKIDISFSNKKNLEKALSIIPAYVDYVVRYYDPCWDDGAEISPTRVLAKKLIPTMREAGYEEREIAIFRMAFLAEIEKQGLSDYFVYDVDEE